MSLPAKVSNQLAPPPVVGFMETRNPAIDVIRVGFGVARGAFDLAGKAINLGIKRYQELVKLDVAGLSSNPISGYDLLSAGDPPFLGGQTQGKEYVVTFEFDRYNMTVTPNTYISHSLGVTPPIQGKIKGLEYIKTNYNTLRLKYTDYFGTERAYQLISQWDGYYSQIWKNYQITNVVRQDGTSQENDIVQGGNPPPQLVTSSSSASRPPVLIGTLAPGFKDATENFLEPEPHIKPTIKLPVTPFGPSVLPPPSIEPTTDPIGEPTKIPIPVPIIFPVPIPIPGSPIVIPPQPPPTVPEEPVKIPVIPVVPIKPPLLPEAPTNPVTETEKEPVKPVPIVKAPPITYPPNPEEPIILEPEKPKIPFIPTIPMTDCEELLNCLGSRLPEIPEVPDVPETKKYKFVRVIILQDPFERQVMNVSTHGAGEDVKMAGYLRFVVNDNSVGPEMPIRRDSQLFYMPEWAESFDLQSQNGAMLTGQIIEVEQPIST